MLHASTQQLIRKLHELTEAGALAWQEGERETSRLETEGYVVEVAASPPGLRLLQGDGRELEKVTAEDLSAVPWPGGEGTYATQVTQMAIHAHRIACGAEQAISTILSSLSAPAKKPSPPPAQQAAQPAPAAAPVEPPRPAPAPVAAAQPAAAPAPPKPYAQPQVAAPFGGHLSFVNPAAIAAPPKPPEPAVPPPPTRPEPIAQGFSARTIQDVEQSTAADRQRLAPAPPKPAPEPAPPPAPAPTPTPRPAPATGPSVYKPWN